VSVPVSTGAGAASEADVKRLTRIILSDIVIYSPDRADQAIREGAFAEVYRAEVEEGRKMIRTRFPNASNAVETYEACLRDLIEARRKELQTTANAL
jgi:cytochrome P450